MSDSLARLGRSRDPEESSTKSSSRSADIRDYTASLRSRAHALKRSANAWLSFFADNVRVEARGFSRIRYFRETACVSY